MHSTSHHTRQGFTLVEMLVSIAVFAIILVPLIAFLSSSVDETQAIRELTEQEQITEIAVTLLRSELRLAGYADTSNPSNIPTPTLEVSANSPASYGDVVTVRFFDDRPGGSNANTTLSYKVNTSNPSGELNLVRKVDSTSFQPVVEGVTKLELVEIVAVDATAGTSQTYVRDSNAANPAGALVSAAGLENIVRMTLELTFANGATERVSIAFANTQKS